MKTKRSILLACILFNTILLSAQSNYWELAWIKFQMSKANGNVNLRKFDWDVDTREELISASDEYSNTLQTNNSFLFAPEIEDYLNQKLKTLYQKNYSTSPYAQIRKIQVTKSNNPEIQVLNNGYIIVTTGMLSLISTEDELNALIVQQLARVVFDLNYSSYNDHKSGLLASFIIGTTVQAFAQAALHAKHPENGEDNDFLGAAAGYTSVIISNSIFNAIANGYNEDLEEKVDSVTLDFLKIHHMNQAALGDVMSKIYVYNQSRNDKSDDDLSEQLKCIPKRLKAMGYKADKDKKAVADKTYDRTMSEALTQNASNLYSIQYYDEATNCINRVIDAGYGIEDTYLIKALILTDLEASENRTAEILRNLSLAETLPTNSSFEIDHLKGLIYYRIKNYTLALEAFTNTRHKLDSQPSGYDDELIWLSKMIAKCKLFAGASGR